jgi:HSP20 family molecular chaperone IbpA
MVATFDFPDVPKEDVHVSFRQNRIIVTWAIAELSEWEEDGIIHRERFEQVFSRMLPVPEGTKVNITSIEAMHPFDSFFLV